MRAYFHIDQMSENLNLPLKVIVLLPQTKVPPRFRSESSAFSMLSSTSIADSQTFDFKYRELDMFLPQTKVCESH